jgi:Ran GTPase-activating protein (RanGAP) involved in mRNA processing and transport
LFSRSDTTITTVTLVWCNFGTAQEESQLYAAFHTNRTVTDLEVSNGLLRFAAHAVPGAYLPGWMQNIPQLRRLWCTNQLLTTDVVRAFQPALQANRNLRELNLRHGSIRDDCIRLLADALVGNPIIEILDILANAITCVGLDDITRLIMSTHIKSINMLGNPAVFLDDAATRRFCSCRIKPRVFE